MGKELLIGNLKKVINALTNDTIKYDWVEPKHCNCGVVARCTLGYNYDKFQELVDSTFTNFNLEGHNKDKKGSPTWRDVTQVYCPVTGISNYIIFKELNKNGLTSEDIVHLEYLSNPAILKASGIKKVPVTEKVLVSAVKKMVPQTFKEIVKKVVLVDEVIKVPSESKIGRFFGLTYSKVVKVSKDIDTIESVVRDVEKIEQVYEEKVIGESYPKHYYQVKSNLILYLKAWVSILEEKIEGEKAVDKESLRKQLLVATAEEDYKEAVRLRDLINSK